MGCMRLEALLLLLQGSVVRGFFDQMFGGGGMQFEQAQPRRVKWPRGVPDECSKGMAWLKGTEWKWNNDGFTIKLEKDGSLEAPVQQCQRGTCKWSADNGKFYFMLGDAGLGEFSTQAEKPADMKGMRMKGALKADGQRITLTFLKIFDFSAVDLDKDIYGALDLPDDASEIDIKKAYRKLSIKYHPDKDPSDAARQKFNDVRDAHEILNDPDKKILFDTGGMEAVHKFSRGEDIQKTDDSEAKLSVTLEELYTGTKKDVSVNRRVVCRGCRQRPDKPACRGCGRCPNEVKLEKVQMGPFLTQQQVEVPSKEKCKQADEPIEITIEKGMSDGEKVSFLRMADQRPGMLPGALILQLKVPKHATFARRGNDLHVDTTVSLREALLGWKQSIRHLDGHKVELEVDTPTKNDQVFKVAGEGMPMKEDSSSFGNLYVKVTVQFPTQLTQAQKDVVEEIFAPSPPRPEL